MREGVKDRTDTYFYAIIELLKFEGLTQIWYNIVLGLI